MRQLNDMLKNRICRPSKLPWASRVLRVTKKDGTKRFCVDFIELNKVTRNDSYPMLHPKDILDKMHGDRLYSLLDRFLHCFILFSVGRISCISTPIKYIFYWSVEIQDEDRYKTAFATPKGLFECNRMPFGLINSGSTYQHIVDDAFRKVKHADAYVDNICVQSQEFQKHVSDL